MWSIIFVVIQYSINKHFVEKLEKNIFYIKIKQMINFNTTLILY